jgi:hypothetical protein
MPLGEWTEFRDMIPPAKIARKQIARSEQRPQRVFERSKRVARDATPGPLTSLEDSLRARLLILNISMMPLQADSFHGNFECRQTDERQKEKRDFRSGCRARA